MAFAVDVDLKTSEDTRIVGLIVKPLYVKTSSAQQRRYVRFAVGESVNWNTKVPPISAKELIRDAFVIGYPQK